MGNSVGVTKLSGKVRAVKPKNITGAVTTDANKWDYIDGTAQSNIDRGQDPTYAMARDAVNADLRWFGSPFGRLIGDEFVSATESQINLLADLTATVGTGPLTNNNSVTFSLDTSDDESPIWNNTVANFVSASSQYLSVPTASAVQVGTNSFMASIFFKTSTLGTLQVFVSYGSQVAGKQYWAINTDTTNNIFFTCYDGTTLARAGAVVPQYFDGRWHVATGYLDRTNNIVALAIDGIYVNANSSNVSSLLTLTAAGENLYIGAIKGSGGSVNQFMNGSLALFKLVNNTIDPNVPLVWDTGQREALSSGTFTVPTNDSNKRLNNKFGTPNTDLAYFYTGIWLEDGEYELQVAYEKGSANGKLDIIMDGFTVISGLDTYNGSTTHNNVSKYYGIKITAGLHTVKIKNNGKNASSSGNTVNLQWINFIKRRGHENGGVDNFLLLGDEIQERYVFTTAGGLSISTSNDYNNEIDNNATAGNGDYQEGTLFIKGGLYRIDTLYVTFNSAAKLDMFFGNSQVLTQLDTYSSGVVRNVVNTIYVRLQQGRQDVRLASNGKNASSTDYRWGLISIRGVRVSD